MRKPTVLELYVRVLGKRRGLELRDFIGEMPSQVQEMARRLANSWREKQVAEYLIQASRGGAKGTGKGSLKHLLWTLRDRGGDLYEPMALYILNKILEDENLPLNESLAERLFGDRVIGGMVQMAMGLSIEEESRHLEFEVIGGYKVAFNSSPLNLLKAAVVQKAALYAASSLDRDGIRTAVLVAIREQGLPLYLLDEITKRAGGVWIRPYENMRLSKENAPTIEALKSAIRSVLWR